MKHIDITGSRGANGICLYYQQMIVFIRLINVWWIASDIFYQDALRILRHLRLMIYVRRDIEALNKPFDGWYLGQYKCDSTAYQSCHNHKNWNHKSCMYESCLYTQMIVDS